MLILSRTMQRQQSGFTLVEIAVVLVIVGFLVGSFIGSFAQRIDTTRRDNTKKELDEIKKILKAYTYSQLNPFLPCPDTSIPPDGFEDRLASGLCNAAVGILPYATLGIGHGDAWGTRYSYWVSNNYASLPSGTGFTLTTVNTGATINTRVGNINSAIVSNAIVVIFSHGKNSLGGISVDNINQPPIPAFGGGYDDELENMDGDVTFISRPPSAVGSAAIGGAFDDIVVWIGSFELKAAMIEAGQLP